MPVIDANIEKESQERYLTYALSVITGRALPDVRDGLKPVQRRILFAAAENLRLTPDGSHRKSAAVVGEVLAKYHPHGDVACYEAMVRMAQDFSLRYPLIDGQGNFGSMDGDNAAAYRYTEVRLRPIALEVLGEIGEETVNFRDNFDSTTREPEVLPSRVPLLLINGASGIAVGMATNIPPHNLKDTVKALVELSKNPEVGDNRLASLIKGPDFPTGCLVLNSKSELQDIYRSGRGSVKMRGAWKLEDLGRGKQAIVVTSVPYGVNKAQLVEKIANLIVDRKVPQLVDIRDESTTDVRIILELAAGADAEVAMIYLYKHTPLDSSFAVNFTVLVPTAEGGLRPELVSLRTALQHFLDFREIITTRCLQFEHRKLSARVHILEGLVLVFDALDEVIQIVRKSEGRSDAANKLQKRFSLTSDQALAIVDMRIYQLSRTSAIELEKELAEKRARMAEIEAILADKERVRDLIRQDLERIAATYGDKRLSPLEERSEDLEFDESMYVVEEEVFAIVTRDGWVKRIRSNNDVNTTRIREGDAILSAHVVSTLDSVLFITNFGSIFSLRVTDLPSSSGFGTPLQKLLRFKDEERVVTCLALPRSQSGERIQPGSYVEGSPLLLVSRKGLGCITAADGLVSLKKSGKRIMKIRDGDEVAVATPLSGKEVIIVTDKAQALKLKVDDIATREGASLGIVLISLKGEENVVGAATGSSRTSFEIVSGARERILTFTEVSFGTRATRGQKLSGIGSVDSVKVITSAAKE